MNLVAQTFVAALDAFQKKEGVWRSTHSISYSQLKKALGNVTTTFAEWDPERGLYFLDFSPVDGDWATTDYLLVDLRGDRGSDHLRFEWAGASLAAVEVQTHAPGPLPFVPEIAEWVEAGRFDRSPALTLEAWSVYLEELVPQTPVL